MKALRTRRVLGGCFCLILSCTVLAQDRPPGPSGAELQKYYDQKIAPLNAQPTDEQRAQQMLDTYEFVGTGHFVIDDALNARDIMQPQQVVAEFRVDQVYKGAEGIPTIKVELNSDMLVIPDGRVSGYVKRNAAWERLKKEGEKNRAALAALERQLNQGRLTQADYATQRGALETAERQRVQQSAKISTRSFAVVHGGSFYDFGGALQPGQKYVLGANRSSDRVDVYVLDEWMNANLYWGELERGVTAALDKMKR